MAIITLVVAMNYDNVIGIDNQLPWDIKEDLRHFREVTIGRPIVMGRKTFLSIGRALPKRKNIVITTDKSFSAPDIYCYSSVEEALNDLTHAEEVCIIGGGIIFKETIGSADRLHITLVDKQIENSTVYFPKVDFERDWRLISTRDELLLDQKSNTEVRCTFMEYIKKGGACDQQQ